MYRRILVSIFTGLSLVLAGCATRSGVAEFQAYDKVFTDSAAVTTSIIDQLAASERVLEKKRRLRRNSLGIDPTFRAEDATIFSELADPPLAAQYRKAFGVVSRYNKIMLGYATGQGFAELEANIFGLANEASSAVAVISGSAGLAAGLTPYLGVLREIANLALEHKSRAVFRERALLYHDDIVGILQTMRDGSAQMFPNLTYSIKNEMLSAIKTKASIDKLRDKHEQVRVLLSDWVVMMDKNISALDAVKVAIENPSLGVHLSGAAAEIADLRIMVETVRKHLAALNAQ